MRAVVPAILEPLECPTAEVASVPRRFGVGVLMILMTAFAVLFAVMKTCGAPPEVFMIIAVLFLAVTLGQILLFQGKHPRRASAVAGAVTFPLEMLCLAIFSTGWRDNLLPDVFMFAASGALCGYVAGCVMASIFLVQERFRRRSKSPATVELLPFTAADFNTLTCWVHDQQFFHLWSQREFRYPLDCDQLAARLSLTVGEPPRVCASRQFAEGRGKWSAMWSWRVLIERI